MLKRVLIIGTPILLRKLFRGKKVLQKIALVLLVIIGAVYLLTQYPFDSLEQKTPSSNDVNQANSGQFEQTDIRSFFEAQRSGVMVATVGNVTRLLKDDNKGSKHQRFLIEIPSGLSLLVAHNIDLAPRVPLAVNDQVLIYGQYEWNHKGGVLHWTHHDPKKIHAGGWIEHQGKRYE